MFGNVPRDRSSLTGHTTSVKTSHAFLRDCQGFRSLTVSSRESVPHVRAAHDGRVNVHARVQLALQRAIARGTKCFSSSVCCEIHLPFLFHSSSSTHLEQATADVIPDARTSAKLTGCPKEVQILRAAKKRMTVLPLRAWTLAPAAQHTATSRFHGRRRVSSARGQQPLGHPLLPTPDTSS